MGPILVLSYKNHALEEFLLDLLKFAPKSRPFRQGMMIRTGKVDSEELAPFSEQRTRSETNAQKELVRRTGVLRDSRKVAMRWLKSAACLRTDELREDAVSAHDAKFSSVSCAYQI